MARSRKVYVVLNNAEADPVDSLVAAFTVKWEMEEWLDRHSKDPDYDSWHVLSVGDGLRQEPRDCKLLDL